MFVLVEMVDTVRIPPWDFQRPLNEAIAEELNKKLANKVVYNVGLCICLYDVTKLEDSYIFPGDGASHTKVHFRYVVFHPFLEEILTGKINCSDEAEQVWVWEYETDEGAHDLYMDQGEEIRFRVTDEVFVDTSPTGPSAAEKEAPAQPGQATTSAPKEENKEKKEAPYTLIGTICEPGLGLLSCGFRDADVHTPTAALAHQNQAASHASANARSGGVWPQEATEVPGTASILVAASWRTLASRRLRGRHCASPDTSLTLSFPFLRERSRVWEDGKEQQLPRDLPSPLPTKRTRTYSATVRAHSGPVFKGVCKNFSRSQGHGFIRPSNSGEDIFVHISDIEGEYVPVEGDEVTYKVSRIPPKNLKVQAVEVKITHLNPGTKHETWSGQIISS
ncbi:III subunit RPC8 DNA-directed RNA polymerase [Takifugu flavidus]|uniref:III subunit RPC8 DNA-directed RNA polymerase n=1 Tax=Takifugu flavidus TaxID=433684 RepID=A0A5C6NSA6_9TELE|nr:III subunit RPC8 DNA-directed RNA polymerase [Takifugu flavidus]